MKPKQNKKTSNAVSIIRARFFTRPDKKAELEKMRADESMARKIYILRTEAGLSQRALARKVGTTASVICRLEDADYEGHSLAMLNRIAEALDRQVEIRFVARKSTRYSLACT